MGQANTGKGKKLSSTKKGRKELRAKRAEVKTERRAGAITRSKPRQPQNYRTNHRGVTI